MPVTARTQRASRVWEAARDLLVSMPPEATVSDLSDMDAATLETLIQNSTQEPAISGIEIERLAQRVERHQ